MIWRSLAAALLVSCVAVSSEAQVFITEWAYQGASGEFVEFTNMSAAPVSMVNWHYSDSDQGASDFELAAFGTLQPGESAILTDVAEAAFRTAWGLSPSVKIIGSNSNSNLGRVDEINLFHAGALIDRLTYGDNRVAGDPPVGAPATAGSIRTQNRSGSPSSLAALGANNVYLWDRAPLVGEPDKYGTFTSTGADRGNPGYFYLAVPEPGAFALALFGFTGLCIRRRGR
jgi:hypothetical protein